MQEIIERNGGDENAPEVVEYRKHVDVAKANTADPELVDAIDTFLGENLA